MLKGSTRQIFGIKSLWAKFQPFISVEIWRIALIQITTYFTFNILLPLPLSFTAPLFYLKNVVAQTENNSVRALKKRVILPDPSSWGFCKPLFLFLKTLPFMIITSGLPVPINYCLEYDKISHFTVGMRKGEFKG